MAGLGYGDSSGHGRAGRTNLTPRARAGHVTKVQLTLWKGTSVGQVVGMSPQNAESTVELFQQDDAGDFVRQGHFAQ